MTIYQVKEYFQWGSLQLEPLQKLVLSNSDIDNCWVVRVDGTDNSIVVSTEALQNQCQLGRIGKI